jgi:hypothetical protein
MIATVVLPICPMTNEALTLCQGFEREITGLLPVLLRDL